MASMQLKTFRGNSMADALAEVKKVLGSEAVILHARTIRVGGVIGFGAKNQYEITASAGTPGADLRQPRIAQSPRPVSKPIEVAAPQFEPAKFSNPTAAAIAPSESAIASPPAPSPVPTAGASESPVVQIPPPRPAVRSASARLATRADLKPTTEWAARSVDEELASIKRLVGQLLQEQRISAVRSGNRQTLNGVGMSDPLSNALILLTDRLVSATLASELVGEVRDALDQSELDDESVVRSMLLTRLAARIRVTGGLTPPPSTAGTLVIGVVGPTGVGKTTTIAKIAATYKLRHGKRVGLITCDTYRIAAVDQLRTYANIIGLPLKVALTPMEVTSAKAQLADCDVLLVDTPGRAPSDQKRLDELRRFVDAAAPRETHLALAACAAEGVMRSAARAFGKLGPDRVLLTKVDEADTLGPAFNVLSELNLPLACVTTGQEVPDDMEGASAERFARWVLEHPSPVAATGA
ncbi:MAG: flagellar biosynthesis protein FlhF [Planctomycetes bacterium]|nr:flagellar biosynthesis protein FlhF [Planctomycetota bacterium]